MGLPAAPFTSDFSCPPRPQSSSLSMMAMLLPGEVPSTGYFGMVSYDTSYSVRNIVIHQAGEDVPRSEATQLGVGKGS